MARMAYVKFGAAVTISSMIVGCTTTAFAMTKSFTQTSERGSTDPGELSESVASAMVYTAMASPVAALGLLILIVGLFLAPKSTQPDAGGNVPHQER